MRRDFFCLAKIKFHDIIKLEPYMGGLDDEANKWTA